MAHMWRTRRLTDKSEILAYLETDRLYAAYAIGDLEQDMYEQCTWIGAERGGKLLQESLTRQLPQAKQPEQPGDPMPKPAILRCQARNRHDLTGDLLVLF